MSNNSEPTQDSDFNDSAHFVNFNLDNIFPHLRNVTQNPSAPNTTKCSILNSKPKEAPIRSVSLEPQAHSQAQITNERIWRLEVEIKKLKKELKKEKEEIKLLTEQYDIMKEKRMDEYREKWKALDRLDEVSKKLDEQLVKNALIDMLQIVVEQDIEVDGMKIKIRGVPYGIYEENAIQSLKEDVEKYKKDIEESRVPARTSARSSAASPAISSTAPAAIPASVSAHTLTGPPGAPSRRRRRTAPALFQAAASALIPASSTPDPLARSPAFNTPASLPVSASSLVPAASSALAPTHSRRRRRIAPATMPVPAPTPRMSTAKFLACLAKEIEKQNPAAVKAPASLLVPASPHRPVASLAGSPAEASVPSPTNTPATMVVPAAGMSTAKLLTCLANEIKKQSPGKDPAAVNAPSSLLVPASSHRPVPSLAGSPANTPATMLVPASPATTPGSSRKRCYPVPRMSFKANLASMAEEYIKKSSGMGQDPAVSPADFPAVAPTSSRRRRQNSQSTSQAANPPLISLPVSEFLDLPFTAAASAYSYYPALAAKPSRRRRTVPPSTSQAVASILDSKMTAEPLAGSKDASNILATLKAAASVPTLVNTPAALPVSTAVNTPAVAPKPSRRRPNALSLSQATTPASEPVSLPVPAGSPAVAPTSARRRKQPNPNPSPQLATPSSTPTVDLPAGSQDAFDILARLQAEASANTPASLPVSTAADTPTAAPTPSKRSAKSTSSPADYNAAKYHKKRRMDEPDV